MAAFHTPATCERDVQQTQFMTKGWKSIFRCPACGRVRWQALNFLGRRRLVCDGARWTYAAREECRQCAEGSPVPHEASKRCESGSRPHCTCDTCY